MSRLPRPLGAIAGLGSLGVVAVELKEVALVLAVGLVAAVLVGLIALIVMLFCRSDAPSRRLGQLLRPVLRGVPRRERLGAECLCRGASRAVAGKPHSVGRHQNRQC